MCQYCERPIISPLMKLPMHFLDFVCTREIQKKEGSDDDSDDEERECSECKESIPSVCYLHHVRRICNSKIFKCGSCHKKYRKTRSGFPSASTMKLHHR